MASSGVSTLTVTRDEIIERALRIVNAIAPGESPAAADYATAADALNAMIQAWTVVEPPRLPWTVTDVSHALVAGTTSVTIGPGGDVDTIRPLRVTAAWYEVAGQDDVPLLAMTEEEWDAEPDKDKTGDPQYYLYLPEIPLGKLILWPVVSQSGRTLKLRVSRPLYDFTDSDDTPDFPRDWNNALCWCLAAEIAPEYGLPEERVQRIEAKSSAYLTAAFGG